MGMFELAHTSKGIFDSMMLTKDRAPFVGRSLAGWVLSRSSNNLVA